jgi:hypothetical protein
MEILKEPWPKLALSLLALVLLLVAINAIV